MSFLKGLQQEVIVSSKIGEIYSTLNEAIINIGDIKTFRIETAIKLTANITFPAGCTIVIGSHGSLAGMFTLTGNNTVIKFENFNSCINTEITFAGTWIIEKLHPEYFGAAADGVTDDLLKLNRCNALARLTPSKKVVLSGKYKVSNTIIATNIYYECMLESEIIGTDGTLIMRSTGTMGTYYDLDSNAIEGTDSIVCSNATLLASLSIGDIVNIKSSKIFAIGLPQGELKKIQSINGSTIIFKDYLYDTYNVDDKARIAKVSTASFGNSGTLKLSMPSNTSDIHNEGLWLNMVDSPTINVSVSRCSGNGIQISDCYEAVIHGKTHYGEVDGFGYGIAINGASCRAKIYGDYIGHRGCVDLGGNTNGVPWDIGVFDVNMSVTVKGDGAGFLSHLNTGSVNLYNCTVNGSGFASAGHRAYTLNGRYNKLINCSANNIFGGVFSNGTAVSDVYIENFTARDCAYGIGGNADAPIPSLRINGFHIKNTSLQIGFLAYFSCNSVGYWEINNLSAYNLQGGIYLSTSGGNTFPSTLYINGFQHKNGENGTGASIILNNSSIVNLILENFQSDKVGQIICSSVNSTGLKIFKVNNGFVETINNARICELATMLDSVIFNGVIFKNPVIVSSKLLYTIAGLTTLSITNCRTEGANMKYLTDVAIGKTFTNFIHIGNDFVGLSSAHKTQTPTNTKTCGSVGL